MTKVSELMTRGIPALSPMDSVESGARIMEELQVDAVPICDDGRYVGVVTDRDIALGVVARGLAPGMMRLGHLVSFESFRCYDDQGLDEVLRQQGSEKRVRRLPVIDRQGRLVGMLSLVESLAQTASVETASPASRLCADGPA